MSSSQGQHKQPAEQASPTAASGEHEGRVEIRLPFLTITRGTARGGTGTPTAQGSSGGNPAGLQELAFYGGAAALAAFGLIDWPVAVLVAAGTYLALKSRGSTAKPPQHPAGASSPGATEEAEEMIVRPLTRKAPHGEQIADGRMAEENHAKELLARLEKRGVDTPEFTATFTQFRQLVLAHADAEETLEFPLLRQARDHEALEKARSAVERAEKMAPTHPHPNARSTAANYVAGPFAAMLDRARDAFSKAGS